MVVAPALLLAVAVAAFHHSNALLFSQAWGSTDPLVPNRFGGPDRLAQSKSIHESPV